MNEPEATTRLSYRPDEVAAMTGLTVKMVRRLIQTRKLPATRIGRRTTLIHAEDVRRLLTRKGT